MSINRRHFVVGTAAATAGVALAAEGCSSSSVMKAIAPIIPGMMGYTLNVEYATTNIGGYSLHTRTYNGATAGPTLTASPGSTLVVTINNQLPPNPPQPVPVGHAHSVPTYRSMDDLMMRRPSGRALATAPIDPMNNPNHFNTTNLHVHGIQTVPHLFNPVGTANPMAEMIAIEPGQQFTYSFPIPPDHPGGLFWYHPHHHGSTDVQVSGGMAGLIVVPGPIDQVPEIAAARQIFMVIQTLNVNPAASGAANAYEYEPVPYSSAANGYTGQTTYTMFTVNGQGVLWVNNNSLNNMNVAGTPLALPQFTMQPGEVVRLRLLQGTNNWYLPLVLPGMKCYLLANDGVNLPAPVPLTLDFTGTVTQFNLNAGINVLSTSSGNRIEMLIQAPTTPGTYTLSAAAQNGVGLTSAAFNLAQFVVTGTPVTMSIPATLPAPTRDAPIADSEVIIRRTIVFHQSTNQPAGFDTVLTGFYPYINDSLYDEMAINYSPLLGSAEEWTIINGTTCAHPFHIHVNSFQLMEINGVPQPQPNFWDTFTVPPAQAVYPNNVFDGLTPVGSIKIRIRFKEWTGKSVFHCHILNHEDTGMMNNILIG
jgi:suppressor of ftsI